MKLDALSIVFPKQSGKMPAGYKAVPHKATPTRPKQTVRITPAMRQAIVDRKARYAKRKRLISNTQSLPGAGNAAKRLDYNNDSILRAEAAGYVYDVDEYNRGVRSVLPPAPVGLTIVDPKTVPGLDKAVFTDKTSGFGAALFESEINGETMLTYRGTNNAVTGKEDWMTNALQGIGKETTQYTQAMKLAEKAKVAYGNDFTSVGHSLGGGLASASVAITGVKGYTYNSAGLHPNTASRLQGMSNDSTAKLIKTQAVEGEVLTMAQQKGNSALKGVTTGVGVLAAGPLGALMGYMAGDQLPDIPQALGEMQRLPSVQGGSPIARHGMDQVIEGIEAQKQQDIHTLQTVQAQYHGSP